MTLSAVTITKTRLIELEQKERAHDDYLEAMKRSRAEASRVELALNGGQLANQAYVSGYRKALSDLSQHIVDVAGERPYDG